MPRVGVYFARFCFVSPGTVAGMFRLASKAAHGGDVPWKRRRRSLREKLFSIGMNILMLMANLYGKFRYRLGGSAGWNRQTATRPEGPFPAPSRPRD